MVQVWNLQRRARMVERIRAEAARVANRLGASHLMVIAFFPDGDDIHTIDAGTSPVPTRDLYAKMASAIEALEMNDGEDVTVN